MTRVKLLILLVTFLNFSFSIEGKESAKSITILALMDFHGSLKGEMVLTKGSEKVQLGGASLLASYIKMFRKKNNNRLLVLDGGDAFQGSMASNMFEGQSVVDFYNYIGVAASSVGNHEFDYGPVGLKSVYSGAKGEDPRGALKVLAKRANYPFLSANLFIKSADGKLKRPAWLKPSTIVKVDGVKIGIVGASSEYTPATTVRKNLVGLHFTNPVEPILKEANKLRKEGVDFLLLVIHEGGECKDQKVASINDLSTCDMNSDLFKILKRVPYGAFDLAVGGHSHHGVLKNYNGIAVLQSYSKGKYLGHAKLELYPGGKKIVKLLEHVPICDRLMKVKGDTSCVKYKLRKFEGKTSKNSFFGKEIKEDQGIQYLLKPYYAKIENKKKRVARVEAKNDIKRDYKVENPLGNLLSDFMLEYFKDRSVEIAITNHGGIRADLKKGVITYGDIFNVQPFDNKPAIITLSGLELRKLMDFVARRQNFSWSGITFDVVNKKAQNILINGKLISDKKEYKIVTNNYLATGGDGFKTLFIPESRIKILEEEPYLRDITFSILNTKKVSIDPLDYYDPKKPRMRIIK